MKINYKDRAIWDKFVDANGHNDILVRIAYRTMELLENHPEPLINGYHPNTDTAHGMICKANEDLGISSISGFMANVVAVNVSAAHERGQEFIDSYNNKLNTLEPGESLEFYNIDGNDNKSKLEFTFYEYDKPHVEIILKTDDFNSEYFILNMDQVKQLKDYLNTL